MKRINKKTLKALLALALSLSMLFGMANSFAATLEGNNDYCGTDIDLAVRTITAPKCDENEPEEITVSAISKNPQTDKPEEEIQLEPEVEDAPDYVPDNETDDGLCQMDNLKGLCEPNTETNEHDGENVLLQQLDAVSASVPLETELDMPMTGLDMPMMGLDMPLTELDMPMTELDTTMTGLDMPLTRLDTTVSESSQPESTVRLTEQRPGDLRRFLDDPNITDVILDVPDGRNLGIFVQHSPFYIPKGKTLHIESTLNVQHGAELIIKGTVIIANGGRLNNQGGSRAGGTIIVEEGASIINYNRFENTVNSALTNHGSIHNYARLDIRNITNNYGSIVNYNDGRMACNSVSNLYNHGSIVNYGRFFIDNIADNYGSIVNNNSMEVRAGAVFNNHDTIDNSSSLVVRDTATFNNHSTIENNSLIIRDTAIFNNNGTLNSNSILIRDEAIFHNRGVGVILNNNRIEVTDEAIFFNHHDSINAVTGAGAVVAERHNLRGFICIIPAIGCRWMSEKYIEAPTCLTPGVRHIFCDFDEYHCAQIHDHYVDVPALGHNMARRVLGQYSDGVWTPTPTATGRHIWIEECTRPGCNHTLEYPADVLVVFNTAGGLPILPIQAVIINNLVVRPVNPARDGHVFVNWILRGEVFDFNTPIGQNIIPVTQSPEGFDIPVTPNQFIILLAQWAEVEDEDQDEDEDEGENGDDNNGQGENNNNTQGAAVPPAAPPAPPVVAEADDDDDDDDIEIEDGGVPLAPLPEAPPADTEPEPPPADDEEEESTILITEPETPLAPPGNQGWALWNLILGIAGAILAILMGIRILMKKRQYEEHDEDEEDAQHEYEQRKHTRKPMVFAIPILAIAGIVLLILTQDMRLPMIMFDWWTPAHAILFASGAICYIFAFRREKDNGNDDKQQFLQTA